MTVTPSSVPSSSGTPPSSGTPSSATDARQSTNRTSGLERRLAKGALVALLILAVPAGAVAGMVAGTAGVVSALIGLALVLVLFGASALLLAYVAEHAPKSFLGALVAGLVVRLALYLAALIGLSMVSWVHRPSLAIATVVGIGVTLAYELILLNRSPRLFWVDAAAGRPSATSDATRSRSL